MISGNASRYHYDGEIGFDGQFAYFIAVDPERSVYYADAPAYRYTRILYPLLAGTLALGKPVRPLDALIGLNLGMIALGTLVLAAWLGRKGVSPWVAAIEVFILGLFIALQRDTTEIMAYSLVAFAIYLNDFGPRWRATASAAVFALSLLAKGDRGGLRRVWPPTPCWRGTEPTAVWRSIGRQRRLFWAAASDLLLAWKVRAVLLAGRVRV